MGIAYEGLNNTEKALMYYKEAARKGNADAQNYLSEMERNSNRFQRQTLPSQNALKKDPNFKIK
jgi:TPR repeat protein